MIAVQISHLNFCGDGCANTANHRQIHVANALPGETVSVEDVSIMRNRQACLCHVLTPSPIRQTPVCPNWKRCPACQFQCLPIEEQRLLKKNNWLKLIQKFTKIPDDCTVSFLSAPKTLAYRHRTDIVVFQTPDTPVFGIAPRLDFAVLETLNRYPDLALSELEAPDILGLQAFEPVSMAECRLHAPELNALIQNAVSLPQIRQIPSGTTIGLEANENASRMTLYAQPHEADLIRTIAKQLAQSLDCCIIVQVLPQKGSHVYPKPEQISDNPWFCYTRDQNGDPLYALKGAWTPVNPANAALIRNTLIDMTADMAFQNVLELGCGCGTHTAVFLPKTQSYTGIDAAWPAILSAQHNAEINHWKNAAFFTDTAEHYLDKRYYSGRRADAILMHSNRMPYDENTAALCKRFGAAHLFIVAPTAYAMAQECSHFAALGYHLRQLTLCDTLPMTYHMMAVSHLELLP